MDKLSQMKSKDRYNAIKEEYGMDETSYWSNVNSKKTLHTGNSNEGLSTNSWANVNSNKKDNQENLSNPNNPGVSNQNSWSRIPNTSYIESNDHGFDSLDSWSDNGGESYLPQDGFDSLDSWSDVNTNKKYHHGDSSNTYNPGLINNSWDNIDINKKNKGGYRYTPKTVVESVNLITGEKNIEVVPTGEVDYKS